MSFELSLAGEEYEFIKRRACYVCGETSRLVGQSYQVEFSNNPFYQPGFSRREDGGKVTVQFLCLGCGSKYRIEIRIT